MRLADSPRIFRAPETARGVMSGGTLSTSMVPDGGALDRVAADGHPVIGRAPGAPPTKAGTLPGASLTLEALANAADSAARAKKAGVNFPTRYEAMASEAPASPRCKSCATRDEEMTAKKRRASEGVAYEKPESDDCEDGEEECEDDEDETA